MVIKKRINLGVLLAFVLVGFSSNSQAFHNSYESSAESALIGSSFVANSYWLAGIDIYKPVSRSLGASLFQSGFEQGSGEFNDRDIDIGLSLYRFWGPWFWGVGLAGPTTSTETAIRTLLHFGPNDDTTLKLKRRVFGTLLVGYTFMPFQTASLSMESVSLSLESFSFVRQMSFAIAAGLMLSNNRLTLRSDETSGGGVPEKFSDSETEVEPMLKAFARFPTNSGEFQLGLTTYKVSGMSLDGRSSTFGFPYEAKVDNDWQYDLTFSYMWKF